MSCAGRQRRTGMRIILSDFISLDGVVQAPGGKDEDTDGGFRHGGWSMPLFDPEVMGTEVTETMAKMNFSGSCREVMTSCRVIITESAPSMRPLTSMKRRCPDFGLCEAMS